MSNENNSESDTGTMPDNEIRPDYNFTDGEPGKSHEPPHKEQEPHLNTDTSATNGHLPRTPVSKRRSKLPLQPIKIADPAHLRLVLEDMNEKMGFIPDPDATLEKVHAMMLADGIRPEDNVFSSEIIRMRYGNDE